MGGILKKEQGKNVIFVVCVAVILLIRFLSVFYVPDVFCDEGDIMNHIRSLLAYHTDSEGNDFPLYSKVGAGLTTYTYIYPMALLCKFFGISALRVRVLQQIITVFSCFISALAIKNLNEDSEIFRIILVISLTLPWGFVQANRIWDPAFVPLYFSLHLFFFSLYYKYASKKTRITKIITNVFLAISFGSLVLLAVVYPPCRIPAVAMWVYVVIWLLREKKISFFQLGFIVVICTILSIPLAVNLTNPEFNARATSILVFNEERSFWDSMILWVANFAELIGPKFLFVTGDINYRHAVPYLGMLGTLSIIPMIKIFKSSIGKSCKYMLFTIIMTFISVALTDEGMPHSLRSCLAWIPFSILIGYGWKDIADGRSGKKKILLQILVISFFMLYAYVYYNFYSNLV